VLREYFKGEKRAALALARRRPPHRRHRQRAGRHTQFAQADGSASVAAPR